MPESDPANTMAVLRTSLLSAVAIPEAQVTPAPFSLSRAYREHAESLSRAYREPIKSLAKLF